MYACVAQILFTALHSLKIKSSLASLYLPAVVFLFANRAVPGPAVAGLASLVYLLGKRKVTGTHAQVAAGSFYLADYLSFFVFIIFAAVKVMTGRGGAADTPWSYGLAIGLIVLAFVMGWLAYRQAERLIQIGVGLVRIVETWVRPTTDAAEKIGEMLTALHNQSQSLLRDPRTLLTIVGTGVVMHGLEACTIVCAARAFDGHLSFGAAAGGYVAGNLAALVSFLPGGVGLYDGAMISILHTEGQLTLPAAGVATVVYRLLSLAIPFPIAITAIRQALKDRSDLDNSVARGDFQTSGESD